MYRTAKKILPTLALTILAFAATIRGQATATLTTIYDFNPLDNNGYNTGGAQPIAGVTQGNDGNLYGTTDEGGSKGGGVIYEISLAGSLTALHDFGDGTYGNHPEGGIIQGTDGNFYGADREGSTYGVGTIYQLTSDNDTLNTLYTFGGDTGHGARPKATLCEGSDGNFYGTTYQGGSSGNGTVFRITSTGALTTLYFFGENAGDGSEPRGGVIEGSDGNYYGTTESGGENGEGTVFQITPAGVLTTLYSFGNYEGDGAIPYNNLVLGTDGNFYGTTEAGGEYGLGTVYQITYAGVVTPLYSFSGVGGDGANPYSALTLGADGNFYGTTFNGGTYGAGTVFQITPKGVLTTLYDFTGGSDGANPEAAPFQASDGNFYGTTNLGGTYAEGTIFRLTLPPSPGTLQFVTASYDTSENAGTVTLIVSRTKGSAGAVTCDYSETDGTAVAGTDYESVIGTLSWTDGDTSDKTITIPIDNRGITGGSTRAFSVLLSGASNGAMLGTVATASVTITENDVSPIPTITSAQAADGQINLPFTFQVTASNSPTSFAASGLPAGLTLDSATGLISGKSAHAGAFSVMLTATNAGGSGTGSLALTLVAPEVNVTDGGKGIAIKGESKGMVIFTRTGKATLPLTVYYRTSGSAKPEVDYKRLPGKLIIPAGALKARVGITPLDGLPAQGLVKVRFTVEHPADGDYVADTSTAAIKLER